MYFVEISWTEHTGHKYHMERCSPSKTVLEAIHTAHDFYKTVAAKCTAFRFDVLHGARTSNLDSEFTVFEVAFSARGVWDPKYGPFTPDRMFQYIPTAHNGTLEKIA